MAIGPLPSWLSSVQLRALFRVLDVLDELGVPFVATGGLAGNLHGSAWPLHDLDFDVAGSALPALASRFQDAVVFGPAPFRDEEFALELLTLELDGVGVDFSAAESVMLVAPDGGAVPRPTRLDAADQRSIAGRPIPVMPLADLIAYKRIIGRERDVEDLEAMRRRGLG